MIRGEKLLSDLLTRVPKGQLTWVPNPLHVSKSQNEGKVPTLDPQDTIKYG